LDIDALDFQSPLRPTPIFLRRYSLDPLPNNPKLCRRAAEFSRKRGKEDLARKVEARSKASHCT
jgi:hypothetical protein